MEAGTRMYVEVCSWTRFALNVYVPCVEVAVSAFLLERQRERKRRMGVLTLKSWFLVYQGRTRHGLETTPAVQCSRSAVFFLPPVSKPHAALYTPSTYAPLVCMCPHILKACRGITRCSWVPPHILLELCRIAPLTWEKGTARGQLNNK